MSTLFDTFYDSFCHELHLGDPVFIKVKGQFIFGTVVKFDYDKSGNQKFVVVPSVKYKEHGIDDLKRSYRVSDRNIFLAVIKKKENEYK